jgi:sugar/nucleoside kinase (ribokinase family)
VEVSGIHRTGRLPTGTAFVTYRKDGTREFILNLANSATSLIDADSVDATLTEGCRFFHVMGTSLTSGGMIAAVKRGIRWVKEVGGKVSFDPNIRREVMSSDFIRDEPRERLHRHDPERFSEERIARMSNQSVARSCNCALQVSRRFLEKGRP